MGAGVTARFGCVAPALALALLGCHPVPDSFPEPPRVELGSTADVFRPLSDGDAVQIVHGIQGGYHVWGAVRATFVDPREVRLRYTLRLDDGTLVTVREDAGDLEGTDDGLTPGQRLGTAVFLPDPATIRGRRCRLSLELTDQRGRTGEDAHDVMAVDAP